VRPPGSDVEHEQRVVRDQAANRPDLGGEEVDFEAIRRRYQAMMVSGVTIVATLLRSLRPSGLPLTARRRR